MTGIDHTTAGIDVRTIFSFTKKSAGEALEQIVQMNGVDGCVILSTCNRMELWLSTDDTFDGSVYDILCQIKQVDPSVYKGYFKFRQEKSAIHHLFRLAGGLESRILGEDQIVTQVRDALTLAREHFAAGNVLETLFRQAVTAAKKVKTEIVLSQADQSVVHTAVSTLKRDGVDFHGARCMVIGNGVMGKLAATLLQKEGADVTVTVRQYRSGVVEIPENCSRIDYGKRLELFPECDIVVSATLSPNYTLTKEHVETLSVKDNLILVDLAVPRDIEASVNEVLGVRLYDIDSFREEARSEEQKLAIKQAEALFEEQMDEFSVWYECRDMIPKIASIKELFAKDLSLRLTKKLRNLPVSEEERQNLENDIEAAAVKTVNKMLFELRDGVKKQSFREVIQCLEKIYE